MDKDQTPIGGLSAPMQPTRQLFMASILMDLAAVIASLFISRIFALGILIYITVSRAYSYRGIRLKKFPIIGFLTVFIFQGAVIFFITYHAVRAQSYVVVPILPCLISSCLIGALYPLTQIFQHVEDRKDSVQTISMLLGIRGTFIFSMLFFVTATSLLYIHYGQKGQSNHFLYFLLIMFPVVLFFIYWMVKAWDNEHEANFSNSMRMNVLSTCCTAIFFLTILIFNP